MVSIITYLTLAIKLFRDDKTTLIYDLNASVVRTVSSEIRGDLERYSSIVKLLAQGHQNSEWVRVLLSNENELLGFRIYGQANDPSDPGALKELFRLDHETRFSEEKEIDAATWSRFAESIKAPSSLELGKSFVSSKFLAPSVPVIIYGESVQMEKESSPRVLLGIFRADRWWTTLKGQGVVTPFLADGAGSVLLHPDAEASENQARFKSHPLITQAMQSPLALELKSFDWEEKNYLGAFGDVGRANLKVIATAPGDQIYRASFRLINKSVLFALLIVTLAILMGTRVARSLTSPLSALVEATKSVSKGRFKESLAVRSNDEVGELSIAFNSMSESLEQLQKQLVESERHAAIGQVARGVGHEFGNILMRVLGKIDLALLDTKEEKTRKHLETALSAIERAKIILQNLKSYSKTSTEKVERYSLATVFDQTLTLIAHELKTGNILVTKNFQPLPDLEGDSVAMGQVFLNLLINAKQAMPEGGSLDVQILQVTDGVDVLVKDSGTGIPPEVLPKIFETAFSTKGDQGSGLGLSISKSIVEKQGGTIRVESVLGQGALFHIHFPFEGDKK